MKFLSFSVKSDKDQSIRFGVVAGQGVVDLFAVAQENNRIIDSCFSSSIAFLEAGSFAFEQLEVLLEQVQFEKGEHAIYSIEDITFHAPIPRPLTLRDCLVFEEHYKNTMSAVVRKKYPLLSPFTLLLRPPKVWYKRPIYYKSNPMSVVGHEANILWPSYTKKLDYELEVAVVIGKKGKNIPKEEAHEYIAGYTIFNDFSARDIQFEEMSGRLGPAKAKDFDTGNVLGPYLVTPDEVGDPQNLAMTARINGEEWSRGSTKDMHFTFEEIISYISQDETLYPGECIGSGTVGSGCGLELDKWLSHGDVVELEVENIGVLRNYLT